MSEHLQAVVDGVTARLPDEADLAAAFTRQFWGKLPADDLAERRVEDDVGASISGFRVLARRRPGAVHISVRNPQHARDGWQSPHTVVCVLMDDAPFVVDSVLMALSHGGLVTHLLGNVVFSVKRDDQGALESCDTRINGAPREVFLYAEIDRVADEQLPELESSLNRTLEDVRLAVSDFSAMKDKAQEWLATLEARDHEQAAEHAAFVRWLLDDHFTFLGYREFRYEDGHVEQVDDSALGVLKKRRASSRRKLADQPQAVQDFLLEPVLLSFSKSGTLSLVHRPAYPDYVGMRVMDEHGRVVGEHGFLGLYTSRVYLEHPSSIPIVRRKVEAVVQASGLDVGGFDGKTLSQVLATYPRDELLQIDSELLEQHALGITYIHERRRTRAFFRFDRYGLFVTCLVYLPRDIYNTDVRTRLQALLVETFDAEHAEFDPYFSESILVRLHFRLRVRPGSSIDMDVTAIEQRIVDITRDWRAELAEEAVKHSGERDGRLLSRAYASGFPAGYREVYSPRNAVDDMTQMQRLAAGDGLVTHLFRLPEDPVEWLRLKVYHSNVPLPLSDVIPALENMGLRVLGESAHMIRTADGARFSIQDFQLRSTEAMDLTRVAALFEDSFAQIWHDRVDNDRFNRLTFLPGLTWQQVEVLRACARYNKQLRFGFSLDFMADVLVAHPEAARLLVSCFEGRFSLGEQASDVADLEQALLTYLDGVSLLNEDRILRRFLDLIQATVRTNYFQEHRGALAFKLQPRRIGDVPRPVPEFEIFVCSTQVEGVHLRSGPIARGGLRWSDRLEDYRTEVLGLVKAQTVKNAVIVPVGAKGGFVVKRSITGDRAKDGVAAYRTFIEGLLSLTDNLAGPEVVPPQGVRSVDGPDPYLVVAADKGTATFSDTANGIAEARGFWLGDAFASGGSNGYDHKKMGITARGAWISVQRHFAERGVDVQSEPVSVLGVGDMGGDVFGNGMLLSSAIELVAAFNHRHIFVDPQPDPATSFAERQRLFDAPSSGWSDYNPELISEGGGVFERSAKRIEVTPQMQARFAIEARELSPDELIHALLLAPVDLIWNGGIGTYVKAASESHDEVGDRANDHLRVDAEALRCRVFGEGGNLGLTQRARIAFDLKSGGVNTDFIDNSAGVDCSDHEVNIKILLGELVSGGELTTKHRNALLEEMTDDVAELVLHNNRRQAQCLSIVNRHAHDRHDEYRRTLHRLEQDMGVDRELEALPSDEVLVERFSDGGELTRPELAVLLAYAKMQIKQALAGSQLLEDPDVVFLLHSAFPAQLVERYENSVNGHRLAQEILATQIANDLVHHVGVTFVMHLRELVGGTVEEIVRAYLVAAAVLDLRAQWREIDALTIDEQTRLDMLLELVRLTRRTARWFLRHRRTDRSVGSLVNEFRGAVLELASNRSEFMGEHTGAQWREQAERWQSAGVPQHIAERAANAGEFGAALPIIHAARDRDQDVLALAHRFTALGEALQLGWLTTVLSSLATASHWQAMERDSVLDEVTNHQGLLAARTLASHDDVGAWLAEHPAFESIWRQMMDDVKQAGTGDFSMYAMTCRKLTDLCRTLD